MEVIGVLYCAQYQSSEQATYSVGRVTRAGAGLQGRLFFFFFLLTLASKSTPLLSLCNGQATTKSYLGTWVLAYITYLFFLLLAGSATSHSNSSEVSSMICQAAPAKIARFLGQMTREAGRRLGSPGGSRSCFQIATKKRPRLNP